MRSLAAEAARIRYSCLAGRLQNVRAQCQQLASLSRALRVVTLVEARDAARCMLAERTLGRHRPEAIKFEATKTLFLSEKEKSRRASTVRDLTNRLRLHFSFKGQLADFTHSEAARRVSRIPTNREHNHALRVGNTFFNWCIKRRYITENPLTGIERRSVKKRKRVLTDDELKQVWIAAGECGTFGIIVRLLMLTGQRVA